VDRILEALQSNMWPNMTYKSNPKASHAPRMGNDEEDVISTKMLADLSHSLSALSTSAKSTNNVSPKDTSNNLSSANDSKTASATSASSNSQSSDANSATSNTTTTNDSKTVSTSTSSTASTISSSATPSSSAASASVPTSTASSTATSTSAAQSAKDVRLDTESLLFKDLLGEDDEDEFDMKGFEMTLRELSSLRQQAQKLPDHQRRELAAKVALTFLKQFESIDD
jgi:hypothetical protein